MLKKTTIVHLNWPKQKIETVESAEDKRLYDLHIHSTHSDGRLGVEALIELAIGTGLSGISLTDHDTIAGLADACRFAHKAGISLVPGIELNTDYGQGEVHILGYYINPHNDELIDKLADLKRKRWDRARIIVDKLASIGYCLDFERVRVLAGEGVIGRPHVARAMVERQYVLHEKEAFERFIGRGKPAFVPRYNFTPQEAIRLVNRSGGLPFLAHPGKIGNRYLISSLIEMGIVGLEVYYPEHSESDIQYFIDLAVRNRLLVSGGSDFHGPGSGEKRETLGLSGINENEFRRIREVFRGKTV